MEPQLVADFRLYPADNGLHPPVLPDRIRGDWFPERDIKVGGWMSMLLLGGKPMDFGETRRIGIVFLSPDKAIPILKAAGTFYLWRGRFIGEATAVEVKL